ncbi:50S ribosomal protein L23 [Natranaerobius thermophilus]|uniref:Large ribosomal subunit protein uL23 n=1 Tax=Natranaerobius thermophilus (strain ATCC BAA-1301 / DSM 18059 / JW/NM-WN-LF) TaxID=457570 RepID=RL23_NATTJ|nr:50S ribosomal protein L23 [Natranaerobius thermophilus]B2A4E1.1 RecName: Full=Large ribosomal subunit protein uL23; AltName: Full=50S ribosomal protein L23 [Natranaerobius thermophilus JW/NM-WN-LF]ACB83795.1 LSU ribosomal protein L23P [Natranaerobius thermophilus JW/NM-WN-LF]
MDPRDVIIKPWITEQSTDQMEENKYTFVVAKDANKTQIKDAVQKLFGVKVKQVNTMNMKGKPKRLGIYQGKTPSWKKAIITLTDDSKAIDLFE